MLRFTIIQILLLNCILINFLLVQNTKLILNYSITLFSFFKRAYNNKYVFFTRPGGFGGGGNGGSNERIDMEELYERKQKEEAKGEKFIIKSYSRA